MSRLVLNKQSWKGKKSLFLNALFFNFQARVSYPNKEIAVGVPMRLTVDHGGYRPSILSLGSDRTITNSEGVATTIFDIPRQARRLNIKV